MRICNFVVFVCLIIVGCGPPAPSSGSDGEDSPSNRQQSPARDLVVRDEESIIGFWKVVEASADGDPYPEAIGTIYDFRRDNKLRFVSPENEGIQEYRMDANSRPKTLVTWFFNPENAGSGIYVLSRDALRIRSTLDKQDLRFSDIPHGRWWEHRFVRVAADEAGRAIEALQDKRLENDE